MSRRPPAEGRWVHPHTKENAVSTLHQSMTRNGLVRPAEGRVLAGVCAGIGRRFGIDPWPARLLFVLVLMVAPGSQILVYPILWILMPSEQRHVEAGHQHGSPPGAAATG